LGAVVAHFCTDVAIKLAKENGVGWVVCKASNHFGIAGYWPLLMKEHGLVGFAATNTSPLVFPTRSAEHALGTNPISCIAPALNGDDFALDMATSAVALGKVSSRSWILGIPTV
jgi:LDH2 family malate/lactate/ureidoglycolate dehydrogenase